MKARRGQLDGSVRLSLVCVGLLCSTAMLFGQTGPQQEYRVAVTAGAGYSRLLSSLDMDGMSKGGVAVSARIMWVPEHRLRLGVEAGYHRLYAVDSQLPSQEFGTTQLRSTLSSMPLHAVVAMQVAPPLELMLGSGAILLFSHLDAFGSVSDGSQWSTANFFGVSWGFPALGPFQAVGELKYYRIHKLDSGNLVFQFLFGFDLLRY